MRLFLTDKGEAPISAVLHKHYSFLLVCSPPVKQQEVIIKDLAEAKPGFLRSLIVFLRCFMTSTGSPALFEVVMKTG